MKRTKIIGKHPDSIIMDCVPDLILCSDFHLRETVPVCRMDDFWVAQWKKVDFVAGLQSQYGCPVFHAGDLFHHWKPSPYLLSMTMEHLPEEFHTVYGQHDLPQHNLDLSHKSGIHALLRAGKLKIIGVHWGQKPDLSRVIRIGNRKVIVWHNFTYVGKDPWPGITSPKAYSLLEKYERYDLIVTGDNHQSFSVNGMKGNLLVNPGNLTRQTADQTNYQPKVYLWYAEDNLVEVVDVPIEKNVISREHIDEKQRKDERIEAFISRLDMDWEMSMSFEENLKRFFETNDVSESVQNIINKSIEQ
jgi:predicted phosphodiesterase